MDRLDNSHPAATTCDRTIMMVAERVLAAFDPGHEQAQSARLQVIGLGLFGSAAARRRISRTAFDRPRRSVPGGFGAEQLELVAQILLLILNGVGTGLLTEVARRRLDGIGGRLRRRRAARALSRLAAAQGGSTPLPPLRPTEARLVGDLATRLALRTGSDPEQAQLLGTLLAAELSRPEAGT